jgi:hypothetical protein
MPAVMLKNSTKNMVLNNLKMSANVVDFFCFVIALSVLTLQGDCVIVELRDKGIILWS